MQTTQSAFKSPIFGDICELQDDVLPSYEDVMKYYEWTRHQVKLQLQTAKEPSFAEIADTVTSRIENLWKTASIPTVTRTRIIQMIKAYHLKCKNVLKSFKRLSPQKLQSFRQTSKILFDISACKCKEFSQCICPKDRKVPEGQQAFLIEQRTSREIDVTSTRKVPKTLKRKPEQENRRSPSLDSSMFSYVDVGNFSSASSVSESEDTLIQRVPEGKREQSISVYFPTLSKACDKYGVSDEAAAAIASAVLVDIGSDVKVVSRHKLRRERNKNRKRTKHE